MREFRDAAGADWKVFRATPHTSPSKREKVLPESYRNGWLVFECEIERRRLAPVPDEWEGLTDEELELLCTRADIVPARRGGPVKQGATLARATQVQEMLARVIDEVCEQPRAPSLDTGELIRVEETLMLAAETAREAVAMRRAMHARE